MYLKEHEDCFEICNILILYKEKDKGKNIIGIKMPGAENDLMINIFSIYELSLNNKFPNINTDLNFEYQELILKIVETNNNIRFTGYSISIIFKELQYGLVAKNFLEKLKSCIIKNKNFEPDDYIPLFYKIK